MHYPFARRSRRGYGINHPSEAHASASIKRRGLSPGIFIFRGGALRELSVFVDESGTQEGKAEFYVVTLVLHDQDDDVYAPHSSLRDLIRQPRTP